MNSEKKRRAGQPLAVFMALLLCWIGLRMAFWQSPFPNTSPALVADATSVPAQAPAILTGPGGLAVPAPDVAAIFRAVDTFAALAPLTRITSPPAPMNAVASGPHYPDTVLSHLLGPFAATAGASVIHDPGKGANPPARRPGPLVTSSAPKPPLRADRSTKRWSLDAWVFVRPDAIVRSPITGSRFASYGASQAGAVLRYRLSPRSAAHPTAYARMTTALAGARDNELAAGLSVLPIPALPISVHTELRVTQGVNRRELRPAVFAVTEIPSQELPLGLRGEIYLAGGYVGGDFATPFADGQARIDREIVDLGIGSLRAGAGAWGGAQRGAERMDIGPSASLDIKMAAVPARLSLDYRFRVAGDAEPGSGVALTLSTGF